MCDKKGEWSLFVWDESKGMWHREDETHASCFAALSGELYFLDAGTNQIKTVTGNDQENLTWFAQFGEWIDGSYDKKYLSKLQVNAQLEPGASLNIWIRADGAQQWECVYSLNSPNKRTYTIPILPRRCERLEMKLSGKGMCKIFSVAKTVSFGTEI